MRSQASLDEDRYLTISELFGPTIQGEGRSLGRPCVFIRLGLCNLDCHWCDTPYTWDWTGKNGTPYDKTRELTRRSVRDIADWVLSKTPVDRVVITGGEPLLQSRSLVSLVAILQQESSIDIEFETNGTLIPPDELLHGVQWNISPKLRSSGVSSEKGIVPDAIRSFMSTTNFNFKFVVTGDDDVADVVRFIDDFEVDPHNVYLMPEGRSASLINARLPQVIDAALRLQANVTTRLHVLAYDDRRGV